MMLISYHEVGSEEPNRAIHSELDCSKNEIGDRKRRGKREEMGQLTVEAEVAAVANPLAEVLINLENMFHCCL